MLLCKISRSAACLAFSVFFGGLVWAQPQPGPAADARPTSIASAPKGVAATYGWADELLQLVAQSHNSAFIYRQKADGLLQIYVGKYKTVHRTDKLSDRRADLVDAPLSQIWKEASDFLAQAQKWVDTPNKNE